MPYFEIKKIKKRNRNKVAKLYLSRLAPMLKNSANDKHREGFKVASSLLEREQIFEEKCLKQCQKAASQKIKIVNALLQSVEIVANIMPGEIIFHCISLDYQIKYTLKDGMYNTLTEEIIGELCSKM
jgi:hypothetical protein